MEYILAGALGGFIKSLLSHNGRILMPYRDSTGCIVLGFWLDVILGSFIGFIFHDPTIYTIFGLSEPSLFLISMFGFTSDIILEHLAIRMLKIRDDRDSREEQKTRKRNKENKGDSVSFEVEYDCSNKYLSLLPVIY